MKSEGLERQRWSDPIDDFVREYGGATPRWAIVLTYELDIATLARAVLPALTRRGRRFRTVVLADQGALEGSLTTASERLLGAVNLHPVRCRTGGVFHPKLLLLRAGPHVRACFGSANVTEGGLGGNLELWTQTEAPAVLAGLTRFVLELGQSKHLGIDDGARRSIRRALSGLAAGPRDEVWSSLDGSFAERLRAGPEKKAGRATVISPMYASPGGIIAARKAIPAAHLDLYTTARVAVSNAAVAAYDPPHPAGQDDSESWPGTLHAKAYLFHARGRGAALAWTGSANFTAQALTKSVAQGGNVELMVRTPLPRGEARALAEDLERLFKPSDQSDAPDTPMPSAPPRAQATVLVCEIIGSPTAPRMAVHATVASGKVTLVHEGRTLVVAIKGGRGETTAKALAAFLPRLDRSAPHALIIHQQIGQRLFPIVVNMPHVPEAGEAGNQASLDALLDDFRGRVPLPKGGDDEGDDEGGEDDVPTDDDDEIEARLDEVRHQGELDQLAVKAALLYRLVRAAAKAGDERDGPMAELVTAAVAACDQHLRAAMRARLRVAATMGDA